MGEKKNEETSEAIMMNETTVGLIVSVLVPPTRLYFLSTYRGMIVSTLRNSD
jgi:hypothetical protein